MKKLAAPLLFIIAAISTSFCFCGNDDTQQPLHNASSSSNAEATRLKKKAALLRKFAQAKKYDIATCFLVDMSLPSNKKRFFVYDLGHDSILSSGLMAHGSCNTAFLEDARFSNEPDCGCSSLGRYSISTKYMGKFGTAYKLYGLDSSNSNAYKRFIVLHGYDEVPDQESKGPICNSLGCPMVSNQFLLQLGKHIAQAKQPMVLWMFQ